MRLIQIQMLMLYLLGQSVRPVIADALSPNNVPQDARLNITSPDLRTFSAGAVIYCSFQLIDGIIETRADNVTEDSDACLHADTTSLICIQYVVLSKLSPLSSTTLAWFLLGYLDSLFALNSDPNERSWVVPTYDVVLNGVVKGRIKTYLQHYDSPALASKHTRNPSSPNESVGWNFKWTGISIPFRTFARLVLEFFIRFIWSIEPDAGFPPSWRPGTKLQTRRDPTTGVALTLTWAEWRPSVFSATDIYWVLNQHVVSDIIEFGTQWQTFEAYLFGREVQKDIFHLDTATVKGVEDDEILEETGFSGIILPALDRTGRVLY